MIASTLTLLPLLYTLLPLVSAIVTPTTPDGSTVINEGDNIDIAWTADDTGSWNNVTIQLMTGDNFQMIPLRTLATGVDGTSVTTFSTPAPEVEPNSKIYFLQFTNNGETEATWTTRFTIAGADGSTTEPEQTEQGGNGEEVQWGVGAIVGGDNSTDPSAAPSASGSGSASAAPSSTQQSGITNYQPSTTGSPIANPSNGSGPSRTTQSQSASDSAASASDAPNSAYKLAGAGGFVGVVGVLMGLAL